MEKEDVVHIYDRILISHKKSEVMPSATTLIDLEIIIWSEMSKINIVCHVYVEYKIWDKQTYLQNTLTDFENKLTVTKWKRCGRDIN